ncbi:unnamed protein product [Effrenium voratum]|nr:unnamed protein product [Effrenium voratum]
MAKTKAVPSKSDGGEKLEARLRHLEAENAKLRQEASEQRQELLEQRELADAAVEEARVQRKQAKEAASKLAKLQILHEESQRAREAELTMVAQHMRKEVRARVGGS